MLLDIKIKNLILIENIHLNLEKGFIVFTGETGAGKSLLIKAIKLLLGEKGGTHYIKPGAKEGELEALIWGGEIIFKRLQEMGYPPDEQAHIKRIISPNRQKIYINGSLATLNELSALTKDLIMLTSQHEFYTFLSPEKQLEFLDHFLDLLPDLKEYQDTYYKYKNLLLQIKNLEQQISSANLKKDFLLFQIKELETLNIDPEEEKKLLKERERLKNLVFLKEKTQNLISAFDKIDMFFHQILSAFDSLSKIENGFKEHYVKVNSIYYEIKEIARDLNSYLTHLPEDDSALNEIEERLARYEKVKRKYKKDTEGLIQLLEELKKEVNLLDSGEETYEALLKEEEILRNELLDKALKLSEERIKGVPKLENFLKKELKELGMEKAEFKIEVISKEPKVENLTSTGLEEIKFLFSFNPGIPLRPLDKIASGGELSRIFLACKSLLKEKVKPGTMIFDEVDAGIGGITAKKMAQKLKELSKNYQIFCITHLPQIAAIADLHYVVKKRIEKGETKTEIKKVQGEERLKEISRMLGEPENLDLAKKFLSAELL